MLGSRRAQSSLWTEVHDFVGLNQRLRVFVSFCLRSGGAADLFLEQLQYRRPRTWLLLQNSRT